MLYRNGAYLLKPKPSKEIPFYNIGRYREVCDFEPGSRGVYCLLSYIELWRLI